MNLPNSIVQRGLEIRSDYATAVLALAYNPSAYSRDDMRDVEYRAFLLGSSDAMMGRGNVPIMFHDSKLLAEAWQRGHEASTADMQWEDWYNEEIERFEREFDEEYGVIA